MHSSRLILPVVLLMLAVTTTPAYSTTITTYSSLASWQAASTGDQVDNFEGYAPGGSYTVYGAGIVQNGVQFIGISGTTLVADTTSGPFAWANYGTSDAAFVSGAGGVTITLPSAVTAFGINLFTSPAGTTYTVTTLGTPFSVPIASSAPPTFFGVTSDTAFSTVTLQVPTGTTYEAFDNFNFGSSSGSDSSQVPEAGTFFLIGTGLVGIALFRRRTAP